MGINQKLAASLRMLIKKNKKKKRLNLSKNSEICGVITYPCPIPHFQALNMTAHIPIPKLAGIEQTSF